MRMFRWAAAAIVCACFAPSLMAGDCRILFASQDDYANNLGFYIDLEATTETDGQCHLDTLKMYTGVADGTSWRYLPFQPSWQYGHQYQVVVTIAPSYTDVQVDGVLVQHSPGGFAPVQTSITSNQIPDWASSPTVYVVVQGDLSASNATGTASVSNPANGLPLDVDRKSTRLNSSHLGISYGVFCLKKENLHGLEQTGKALRARIESKSSWEVVNHTPNPADCKIFFLTAGPPQGFSTLPQPDIFSS